MNRLIRSLAYQLTRKWICEDLLEVQEIKVQRNELTFFCLSTNPIITFNQGEDRWYFRECPQRLAANRYWDRECSRFFDSLDRLDVSKIQFTQEIPIRISFDDSEIQLFQSYIAEKRKNRHFRKVLRNVDCIAKRIHFSIWEKQIYDQTFFASFHMGDMPELCTDIGVYFLWNMRTAARNFRLRNIVRGKRHSFFSASKAAATQIVAEQLHLAHLITPVSWCRLVVDGREEMFGTLSRNAPGRRMLDTAMEPTPSLQRELICLNVLDVICRQPDHGPNNYNVAADGDGNCVVCAFDNDNPQTFFPVISVRDSLSGCMPLVDGNNMVQRPFMDRQLAENLQKLKRDELRLMLRPYLNVPQIAAVNVRIHRMNIAISKTGKIKPGFLKDTSDWDRKSLAEEMSGKYARTYLTSSARLSTIPMNSDVKNADR